MVVHEGFNTKELEQDAKAGALKTRTTGFGLLGHTLNVITTLNSGRTTILKCTCCTTNKLELRVRTSQMDRVQNQL